MTVKKKLNILIVNVHGLIRANGLELGRDADTGGQTKYVYEYARELGNHAPVNQVYVVTKLLQDKRYAPEYGLEEEKISDNVTILRVRAGGRRYIKKERLWPILDEFVEHALGMIIEKDLRIDLIHSHYADAGYVAMDLANFLNIPFIHTGHSLGIPKKNKLIENLMDEDVMEKEYKIKYRINVETEILKRAKLVITSTQTEIDQQWSLYPTSQQADFKVIPPGIDLEKFYPYYFLNDSVVQKSDAYTQSLEIREANRRELFRFFVKPDKPIILSICRPEKRKNIEGLIHAYGKDKELQALANLAIFAGLRKDISLKNASERKTLTDILLLMDKYDLYGKLAIPKKHDFEHEIPELYRYVAELNGVFVNSSYHEPFGLTLLESAATGLPIVSTDNGGPADIIKNCKNGLLVDVTKEEEIATAIKSIIVNNDQWEQYSKNGIKNVKKYYSWQTHCENLLKTLEEKKILEPIVRVNEAGKSFRDKMFSFEKMVITDIDNTLIGDPKQLDKFLKWFETKRGNFGFGVATGRNIDSALQILNENNVPMPDILITSVGSEIYYHFDDQLIEDKRWPQYLSERWQPDKIKAVLKKFTFLKPQKDNRNFKISYYIKENSVDKVRQVHKALKINNLRYKLIVVENYYLDILPYRASKYKAIVHVSNKWKVPLDNILVAGDSGNDREMLREMRHGVVVSNFQKELKRLRNVYFSKEGYAGAIMDGLKHYHFV